MVKKYMFGFQFAYAPYGNWNPDTPFYNAPTAYVHAPNVLVHAHDPHPLARYVNAPDGFLGGPYDMSLHPRYVNHIARHI